ncbi:MAG: hypothetical protein ACE5JX_17015 [Acidobacteriota bacterium]
MRLGVLLTRGRPLGLLFKAAEEHPTRRLSRLTYDPRDGSGEEEGVAALGRALEHLNLGWAAAGSLLRLPLLNPLLQLIADAVGGGRRHNLKRSR